MSTPGQGPRPADRAPPAEGARARSPPRRWPAWTGACRGSARCRPRTGPGSGWSRRPASPRSSTWFRSPTAAPPITADVFGTAPRELTGVSPCSRPSRWCGVTIEVVEEHVASAVAEDDAPRCARPSLRYAREVAFATAEVYARAAEMRGAWDARLEALVVDSVLRGEADETRALPGERAGLGVARRRGRRARPGARPLRAAAARASSTTYGARPGTPGSTSSAASRATGSWSCSAASTTPTGRRRPWRAHFGAGPGGRRPGRRRPGPARASRRAAAVAGLRAAPGWPRRPAAGDHRRPAARAGALRRRPRPPPAGAARSTARCVDGGLADCWRRSAAFLDHGGSLEGTGPGAVRAPQHRPLPAPPGRRGHRAVAPPTRGTPTPCGWR